MDDVILWLFWSGLYISPERLVDVSSHGPYYLLIIVLILEKYAQRWMTNRLGCTLEQVKEFKKLDEQIHILHHELKNPKQVNVDLEIPEVYAEGKKSLTVGEAK